MGAEAGKNVLIALAIIVVGKYAISLIKRLLTKGLARTNVDATVQSFVISLANILLLILLIITAVSALGVNTTSFAALLASAGVAIGMALSGNLQNFAGGIVILVLRPYKAGDLIEAQSILGVVQEIQIFHTIITTPDNKTVFLPNGMMTSSVIINYTRTGTRRVEWTIGIDYGAEVEKARTAIFSVLAEESRLLSDPAPYVGVVELADSSVNLIVQAWVHADDTFKVKHDVNQAIYNKFNAEEINFPFPQQTIHISKN